MGRIPPLQQRIFVSDCARKASHCTTLLHNNHTTPKQMSKCANGTIVESGMSAEAAYEMGIIIVSTRRGAYREAASSTYTYTGGKAKQYGCRVLLIILVATSSST